MDQKEISPIQMQVQVLQSDDEKVPVSNPDHSFDNDVENLQLFEILHRQADRAIPDQNESVKFDYDLNILKMKKRIEKQIKEW